MFNKKLILFLNKILGDYKKKSKGNVAFKCPFCDITKGKKKLEIHSETHLWGCWVCKAGGKSLYSLVRRMGLGSEYYSELNKLIPNKKYRFLQEDQRVESKTKRKLVSLPKEYTPLWKYNNSRIYSLARDYLLNTRKITEIDIYRHRLGYCSDGEYDGMIIIPNYDSNFKLNYFTTRRFFGNPNKKFLNPDLDRNIVGFENLINWDMPIIITESALDAMTIRNNASPMYGSGISKELKRNIFLKGCNDIVLCMDSEVRALNKAIKYAEMFLGYDLNVNFTMLPKGSDPNELGHEKVWNYILNSENLTEQSIFKLKMKVNLLK